MGESASLFDNGRKLAWLGYFAEQAELDVENVKLMDISTRERNIIPAVEANRFVLLLSGSARSTLFYDMWNAGLGECTVWLKQGLEPAEDAAEKATVKAMIDRGLEGPGAVLIENEAADSAYKVGLQNRRFSKGSVRYVAHEIRAVIMNMLEVRAQDTICIISGESIAVEAAMSAADGTVIAVEYDESDRTSMEENAAKFGLNNVRIIADMNKKTLEALPVPTTAFIVANENLESEIRALLARNRKMRFVIYTLELDMLAKIPALFKEYKIGGMEALQISVSKLRANGMFETKPVPWLISGTAEG